MGYDHGKMYGVIFVYGNTITTCSSGDLIKYRYKFVLYTLFIENTFQQTFIVSLFNPRLIVIVF